MCAVLAIDQGTSLTKALVVRGDGSVASSCEVRVPMKYIGADGVEADPGDLWSSMIGAGRKAIQESNEDIEAVAVANQGESILAWDPVTGRPSSAVIGWQDRRAAGVCNELVGSRVQIVEISGLELDPYFSAPKMAWLVDRIPDGHVMTTTDSWLLFRLSGEYVTDVATASRTLLLDLRRGEWSPELCHIFGFEMERLPKVVDNTHVVGTTALFGSEVPVVGLAVDQQAALFGEQCFQAGEAKCTLGTGAFLLTNVGGEVTEVVHSLSTSVAWRIRGSTTYCVDGQVYTAGSALDWLVRLGLLTEYAEIDRALAQGSRRHEIFVPALAGLAAPFWKPNARGSFMGVSMDTDRYSLVSAVAEGIAASVAVLAKSVREELGLPLLRLRCDGGLTRSTRLMQLLSDLLGIPVDVFPTPHATALGVAAMSHIGLGLPFEQTILANEACIQYEPTMTADEREDRLNWFVQAVQLAIDYGDSRSETGH